MGRGIAEDPPWALSMGLIERFPWRMADPEGLSVVPFTADPCSRIAGKIEPGVSNVRAIN